MAWVTSVIKGDANFVYEVVSDKMYDYVYTISDAFGTVAGTHFGIGGFETTYSTRNLMRDTLSDAGFYITTYLDTKYFNSFDPPIPTPIPLAYKINCGNSRISYFIKNNSLFNEKFQFAIPEIDYDYKSASVSLSYLDFGSSNNRSTDPLLTNYSITEDWNNAVSSAWASITHDYSTYTSESGGVMTPPNTSGWYSAYSMVGTPQFHNYIGGNAETNEIYIALYDPVLNRLVSLTYYAPIHADANYSGDKPERFGVLFVNVSADNTYTISLRTAIVENNQITNLEEKQILNTSLGKVQSAGTLIDTSSLPNGVSKNLSPVYCSYSNEGYPFIEGKFGSIMFGLPSNGNFTYGRTNDNYLVFPSSYLNFPTIALPIGKVTEFVPPPVPKVPPPPPPPPPDFSNHNTRPKSPSAEAVTNYLNSLYSLAAKIVTDKKMAKWDINDIHTISPDPYGEAYNEYFNTFFNQFFSTYFNADFRYFMDHPEDLNTQTLIATANSLAGGG